LERIMKLHVRVVIICLFILCSCGFVKSYASDGDVVLKVLLEKGIITQSEYQEMKKDIKNANDIEQKMTREHVDKHIIHSLESQPNIIKNLTIGGGITMIAQGTLNNEENKPAENVVDADYSVDLEFSASLGENSEAFIRVEAGEGGGLPDDEVSCFWGVNDDAGNSEGKVEVAEAWYEHGFFDGVIAFSIGKLDLSNYFDTNEVANDETTQFLASGFVGNLAIEFYDNGPGTRLVLNPVDFIELGIGVQVAEWENINNDKFIITEFGIKPEIGSLKGNYRFYAWTNRAEHAELIGTKAQEKGYGIGTSLDQQIFDFLTFFARLGFQDKEIYEIDMAASTGFALSGSLWNRDDDTVGFAYGMAHLSDDYEKIQKASGVKTEHESHAEVYYNININEHVSITPDLQVITNALGDNDSHTIWVAGIRGQFTF